MSELPIEKLNNIKLEYLDFSVIQRVNCEIPNLLKNKDLTKIFFKTGKLLLANQKFYSSFYEYVNNNPILNPMGVEFHQLNTKNIDLLWKDIDFCYFAEKNIDI